jgi:hypothetical protein
MSCVKGVALGRHAAGSDKQGERRLFLRKALVVHLCSFSESSARQVCSQLWNTWPNLGRAKLLEEVLAPKHEAGA